MIKYIAITVYDNDFTYYTLQNLLETIERAIINNPNLTKEQIEFIILEGLKFHYIAFQNTIKYKYDTDTSYDIHFDNMEKYMVKHLKIKYNEDALHLIETMHTGFYNGEWVVLDVNLDKIYRL